MDDFSKVKVGDKLWSPTFGFGTVSSIDALSPRGWIFIKLDNIEYHTIMYDNQGVMNGIDGFPQSLFFEEMQFVPLPKGEHVF